MTDLQIIKDLHACIDEEDNRDCGECSQENWRVCRDNLMKQALDLINRQKEEIKKLKGACREYAKIMAGKMTELWKFWQGEETEAEQTLNRIDDLVIDDLVNEMTESEDGHT